MQFKHAVGLSIYLRVFTVSADVGPEHYTVLDVISIKLLNFIVIFIKNFVYILIF